ncbi:UNVERIFIED_CONTAM: hypothetical protein K2H54_014562 [Gekko kuhli]
MWKDASACPPKINLSMKAKYIEPAMIRETEPAPGSEEMFSPDPDLLTINHDDLRTSTPINHSWKGHSIPNSQPLDIDS